MRDFFPAAEAIPLQLLGVVDVAAHGVNDNKVLAHTLANVACMDKERGFTVK